MYKNNQWKLYVTNGLVTLELKKDSDNATPSNQPIR